VDAASITSPDPLPATTLLNPGQLLIIPQRLANTTSPKHLLPDSEVVFSPSATDFDIHSFVVQANGYLNAYAQWLPSTGVTSGADVLARVALENSINPRLLLALLEYESGWVYGAPVDLSHEEYPMGKVNESLKGLYHQLSWAVNQLSIGYYGWREGRLTEIHFSDGVIARLAPDLNAGTTALQYYFAQYFDSGGWLQALDAMSGFPALYERMFSNPWVRAQVVEPLYPPDLTQPRLILPFAIEQPWAFTGGPHGAWERDGAWAALDFAPGSIEPGCVTSDLWAEAAAAGLIVRAENSVVAIDLDGDGREQTGWVLVYLHIAKEDRISAGEWVEAGDRLGHPSCEGGFSTGTHLHLTRKYNGEWIVADGPIPFVLNGWTAHAGEKPYEGKLVRGDETVIASPLGVAASRIIRHANDP
jgi:murein DD-endopeptidase MepM/ murein hydrolase activator NlpD